MLPRLHSPRPYPMIGAIPRQTGETLRELPLPPGGPLQASPSKIWSRDFTLLFLSSLLAWGSFYTLVPTLPLYASERLGASPTQVGTILNILTVSAILARLLTGYALDRWGRRLVYLLSLAAFAVVASSYLRAASLLLLAVMRLLHGVPFGSATTASNTIAADLVPPERRGEGMGAFALGSTLAMAFGPALALAVLNEGQFARLFALGGGLAMVALGLALAVRYPKLRNSRATFSLGSLFERRVGWLALFAALITTGYGAIVTFITIYAMEYGIPRAGMFFTVFALGLVVSRVVGGRIFDRLGPRLPVLGGTAVMAAAVAWRNDLPGSGAGVWAGIRGFELVAAGHERELGAGRAPGRRQCGGPFSHGSGDRRGRRCAGLGGRGSAQL